MMNDIGIDKKQQLYIIKKMINIAIRATYYIFYYRIRNWDSPDCDFFFFFFWLLFCFCCFCFYFFCVFLFFSLFACVNLFVFFNNTISSSIFKLPIHSEIYNCTFKNTNKISLILLLIIIVTISIKLRGAPYPELVKSKCRAFMISMKKKRRGFLVGRGQKLVTRCCQNTALISTYLTL